MNDDCNHVNVHWLETFLTCSISVTKLHETSIKRERKKKKHGKQKKKEYKYKMD